MFATPTTVLSLDKDYKGFLNSPRVQAGTGTSLMGDTFTERDFLDDSRKFGRLALDTMREKDRWVRDRPTTLEKLGGVLSMVYDITRISDSDFLNDLLNTTSPAEKTKGQIGTKGMDTHNNMVFSNNDRT